MLICMCIYMSDMVTIRLHPLQQLGIMADVEACVYIYILKSSLNDTIAYAPIYTMQWPLQFHFRRGSTSSSTSDIVTACVAFPKNCSVGPAADYIVSRPDLFGLACECSGHYCYQPHVHALLSSIHRRQRVQRVSLVLSPVYSQTACSCIVITCYHCSDTALSAVTAWSLLLLVSSTVQMRDYIGGYSVWYYCWYFPPVLYVIL